jgi:hypothetical protein
MRTVLLGTDFMYDQNGNLKPIEINTNTTFNPNNIIENIEDVFDFSELQSFITSNNFIKLTYIGDISELNESLTSFCTSNSIEYTYYNVGGDSLTVPYIEDGDDILIIRSAYDTTAIIDDTYCANKGNFVQLVGESTFGLQYAIMSSDENVINNISTIIDNGEHPNFILKPKYPNYDINTYPKLFKVSTQEELNQVISNSLTNQNILTEFLYCPNKLFANSHIQVVRSYNLLYPPTLQSISLGQNTQLPEVDLFTTPSVFNNETFELESEFRNKYLTNISKNGGFPKLRATDRVEMADGTWKAPGDIVVGEFVKTIIFPNPYDVDTTDDNANFNINYETFVSGLSYTTAPVSIIHKLNSYSKIAKITFDDDSIWEDGENVQFLTVRDNKVRWVSAGKLVNGDQVIAVETEDVNNNGMFDSLLKIVSSVEVLSETFDGWIMSVNGDMHCYITKDTTHNNAFALFEHNLTCQGACITCNGQCYICPNKSQPYCSLAKICTAPSC